MGRDANNQMYPIAWAVVRVENADNWGWFMHQEWTDFQVASKLEIRKGDHSYRSKYSTQGVRGRGRGGSVNEASGSGMGGIDEANGSGMETSGGGTRDGGTSSRGGGTSSRGRGRGRRGGGTTSSGGREEWWAREEDSMEEAPFNTKYAEVLIPSIHNLPTQQSGVAEESIVDKGKGKESPADEASGTKRKKGRPPSHVDGMWDHHKNREI
ncbi:hypothetical protein Tco_0460919 [Tanacetum coccineum]